MDIKILILPVAAMTALGGCVVTGGPTETRDYALSGFDSIMASAGIDVVLTQASGYAVKAQAPEGKLDSIVIEQSGRELKIARKAEIMWFGSAGRYVVNVSAPAYARIEASGGADVNAASLQADMLTLEASGGADIDINGARIGALNASATGGGDIDIDGICASATLSASGGGNFDGEDFDCDTVTASASGGGDIDVGAKISASGAASAGGDVRFLGSPATFTTDESSGGDVSVDAR